MVRIVGVVWWVLTALNALLVLMTTGETPVHLWWGGIALGLIVMENERMIWRKRTVERR